MPPPNTPPWQGDYFQLQLKATERQRSSLAFPSGTSLVAQMVKASAYNAGDLGSIPGLGRSAKERNGNPLQYSCLLTPTDGGARQGTVHGVANSQT